MFIDGAPPVSPGKVMAMASSGTVSIGISFQSAPTSSPIAADGSFEIKGAHGSRIIRPSGLPAGTYLHHVMLRGQDVTDAGFDVDRSDVDGVEIHLTTRPSVMEGEARDVKGLPLGSARIVVIGIDRRDWMWPQARRYSALQTGADGKFRIAGLPGGSYFAVVISEDDRDRAADPDFLDSLRVLGTPFTVNDGATTTVVVQVKR
jgi:hypothetical protein